jgi:transcriptional regulator NrdR family protein
MKCPHCKEDDNFVARTYSRESLLTKVNRRLRLCNKCKRSFETEERAIEEQKPEPKPPFRYEPRPNH